VFFQCAFLPCSRLFVCYIRPQLSVCLGADCSAPAALETSGVHQSRVADLTCPQFFISNQESRKVVSMGGWGSEG